MKKKYNNKGFTLIELLAVIVIMVIISTMAVTSISSAIERNKERENKTKKDVLQSYAKLYYEEHKNSITISNNKWCVKIADLDLTEDEKTDAYGNSFGAKICYNTKTKVFTFE